MSVAASPSVAGMPRRPDLEVAEATGRRHPTAETRSTSAPVGPTCQRRAERVERVGRTLGDARGPSRRARSRPSRSGPGAAPRASRTSGTRRPGRGRGRWPRAGPSADSPATRLAGSGGGRAAGPREQQRVDASSGLTFASSSSPAGSSRARNAADLVAVSIRPRCGPQVVEQGRVAEARAPRRGRRAAGRGPGRARCRRGSRPRGGARRPARGPRLPRRSPCRRRRRRPARPSDGRRRRSAAGRRAFDAPTAAALLLGRAPPSLRPRSSPTRSSAAASSAARASSSRPTRQPTRGARAGQVEERPGDLVAGGDRVGRQRQRQGEHPAGRAASRASRAAERRIGERPRPRAATRSRGSRPDRGGCGRSASGPSAAGGPRRRRRGRS